MRKKEIIKTLIREFHNTELPQIIRRHKEIPINSGKIISIIGPRRSGKTYFLYQTMDTLTKEGTDKRKILYINFEDERINLKAEELELILQSYRELYPDINLSETYFFFDEIQNIDNWQRFLRRLYDSVSKKIFITGSNSRLLSQEIATSLRGRTLAEEIMPLSFNEFLEFKNLKIVLPQDLYDTAIRAKLLNYFKEYLIWGSFPEIIFQPENIKMRILQEYFNVMIYRDIIERYSIRDTFVLKYFIKRLAETVTKPVSIHKIYNDLKSQNIRISKNQLYEFLEYFENAFLIRQIRKKKKSVIKEELTEKKVYFIDNGILRAIKVFEGEDYGFLLENLIFRELYREKRDLYFYKERRECDFLIEEKIPIQVCYELRDEETKKREIEGLIDCMRYYGVKEGTIITLNDEDQFNMNGHEIKIIPAYKWLLREGDVFPQNKISLK
ncbi:ATP-binding protein [Thermodesulfovibrio yellowstonii]|uniref:ATPase n=1 Tax=Thermodesulfovibrio yellowstonii TaxID=28262 RepID=A0A9W6GFF1_9BACT|nr:ATP-binding protein [Thermodesulfovibrio islandicus]GLI52903.1 ATPase [Thermodesulfovibrio islandicus]